MSETRLAVRHDPAADADIPAGSAVLRAVRILEAIAASEDPPPLATICREVSLPKATVYRILGTLEFAGYIAREPGSKVYATGERLNRLAGRVLVRSPSRAARHAILEELAEQIGETCNLTVPQGNSVLYLDRVEVAWPLKASFSAGSCAPMHASASGKLFLSAMPRRARERFVRVSPLVSYTARTQVDPSALLLELESIRQRGHSIDNEEYLPGICGVALPVRNSEGAIVAAISVHAPLERTSLAQVLDFVPEIRSAADAMSLTLEW
ncbi:MAG: IclR family transcriptional regulator [Burkholderiaceae bacterium]|jgi:DNA-binding IclR family transcriptional regulator|nr:IclR family transcriptional regulator [Burkholderiaceae bacterium]MEB2318020.1 IclR family transcriptional regulator [Pseudomonadota bacterium]